MKNRVKILMVCSCAVLSLLLSALALLPEFLDTTFAEGDYTTTTNEIELVLSPLKEGSDEYKIIFNSPKANQGSFGTVGIKAQVTTANAYGYSLFVRSGNPSARLLYNNPKYSSTAGYTERYYPTEETGSRSLSPAHYIASIKRPYPVITSDGSGWEEMNTYGWSEDWNPTTSRGTFHPMTTIDQLVKRSIKETYQSGQDAISEETRVYIGALINDNVMPGNYRGVLVFTAVTNELSDLSDSTYILKYDLNGGTLDDTAFPDQTAVKTGPVGPTFTINENIPQGEGLTFLGWNTDCDADSAAYSAGGTITVTSLETTLCAIWTGTTTNQMRSTVRRITTTKPSSSSSSSEEETEEPGIEVQSKSSEEKTEPLGEVIYEKDNGGAIIIAIICGLLVMLLTFIFLLFMKRRKEEEEELNIEE